MPALALVGTIVVVDAQPDGDDTTKPTLVVSGASRQMNEVHGAKATG